MESDFDTFSGAADRYADVLGKSGLAEYRRLAAAAWDKLPPRSGKPHGDYSGRYDRLQNILDRFFERDGDTDARIGIPVPFEEAVENILQSVITTRVVTMGLARARRQFVPRGCGKTPVFGET